MILAKRQDSPLRVSCGNLLARMISTLTAAHHGYSWDVASLALDRIAIIIASVEGELPEVSPLRTTFSQHIQQSAPLRARRKYPSPLLSYVTDSRVGSYANKDGKSPYTTTDEGIHCSLSATARQYPYHV